MAVKVGGGLSSQFKTKWGGDGGILKREPNAATFTEIT